MVSELSGVHRTTINQAINKGLLGNAAYRSGDTWLIDTAHLGFIQWLASHWEQSRVRGNKQVQKENEMILALCQEIGVETNSDGSTTADWSDEENIAGFRGNHPSDLIRDAANGDVIALVELRIDCGLPPIG